MNGLAEIIGDAQARKRESLRTKWARYSALLAASNAGKLKDGQADELATLLDDLKIDPAQAMAHAASLRDHEQVRLKAQRIPALEAQIAELNPKIEALSQKRAELIARLDAELSPLVAQSVGLSGELQAIRNAVESGETRGPEKYPHLYGKGFDPVAVRPQPSDAQRRESQARIEHWNTFMAVRAELRRGVSRTVFNGDGVQDAIEMCFRYGREVNADKLVWSPEGGWPHVGEGCYHGDITTDPRQKHVLAKAREKARRRLAFDDMGDEGRALLLMGQRLGWLDGEFLPIEVAEVQ